MEKITAVIFAVVGTAITSWMSGKPPSSGAEFAVYALPGGILGYLFGPALRFSVRKIFRGANAADGGAEVVPISPSKKAELVAFYSRLPTAQLEQLLAEPSALVPGAADLVRAEVQLRHATETDGQ